MSLGDWVKKSFGSSDAIPADVRKLSATSESELGKALQSLRAGERGWITLAEGAKLFSTQRPQYAFGEFDDEGKNHLEQFAAQHRCVLDFRPTEGRLYFQRS